MEVAVRCLAASPAMLPRPADLSNPGKSTPAPPARCVGFARHIADIPCAPPASSTRDRARTCSRLAGSCSAQRRGGWRAWGAVRADFERALADPADPAVASAEIASDFRRGAGYVRVTLPRPRVLPGLKGPRVRVTLPRPGGR